MNECIDIHPPELAHTRKSFLLGLQKEAILSVDNVESSNVNYSFGRMFN